MDGVAAVDRKSRCAERPSRGPRASLWYWRQDVGFLRVAYHYVVMVLARVSPSLRVKNWLYRRMGARVSPFACVGLEVTFDIFYPHLITVEEDAIIGFNSTVLCHEYTHRWYRTGPVVVKRGATVGANCTFLPGVVVGEGAIVSAMSLINSDVPPGEVWGGVPARRLRRAHERTDAGAPETA